MLGVTFICVGRMRERYYTDAFAEYKKRLGALCSFETLELDEQRLSEAPSDREIAAALDKEAAEIDRRLPRNAYVIAMCVEGVRLSSPALAERLEALASGGTSRLFFIVGGSFGLGDRIKQRADLRLSVSDMTFPHHLFRVMLAEQVYRALMINAGTRYHK